MPPGQRDGQRGGRWAGVPLPDRRSRRRGELLAAGVAVLGAPDRPALTVRAVCRQAGLTERYFYESFTDRDEFARAVYDHVCASAMDALGSAVTPRAAVERFVTLMVDDPVRGRVLLLVPQTEPALIHSGAEWMPSFIALVQNKLTTIADPAVQNMVATGLIGALTALFTGYLSGTLAVSREQFIDHCVGMLLAQAGQAAARR
ncbi:TetR/AcrR family transcriptional regulator [Mycolicibacterium sp.]|uniref:TetR/AcrR family transcriptional regulator n=1 Tax=Mycolicibacterium sp. TaxID=2320850 RepID=UPI0028B1E6F3|nr:TetR/AcrR family transcriptional regulator [Mycolicibacterium sp.]